VTPEVPPNPSGADHRSPGAGWRWRLRSWSPDYDAARAEPADRPAPRVDAGVEVDVARWEPRRPARPAAGVVVFVDGVQRIDAWADLDGPAGEGGEALFASFAAGAVRVEAGATASVVDVRVERGLFGGPAAPAAAMVAGGERYRHHPAPGAGAPLEVGLQVARDALEVAVVERHAAHGSGALIVVDGPLHHRDHVAGAVGYVKSHRVEYLEGPALRAVVTGLGPGERTPLFLIDAGWTRWSWYVRLPTAAGEGAGGPGWAGMVRCEAANRSSLAEAAVLADTAAATLVRFASSPIKDPRAPQNLVPVGGLERVLRHRLGDREVLERALRSALRAG
jgi:hypothetical protein